jgi:thiamine pyrophosphokinase
MIAKRRRALAVLAGEDTPLTQLGAWARSADVVYAADGGANRLSQIGIVPDIVIGDLDSLADASEYPRVIRVSDQDSSDCDKVLRLAQEEENGWITIIGAEGDRPDHFLASLMSVARSPIQTKIALRRGLGWVLKPGQKLSFETVPGEIVSLIPLGPCYGVTLQGVKWSLNEADLSPNGLVSLSNAALETEVIAEIGTGIGFFTVLSPRLERPQWD